MAPISNENGWFRSRRSGFAAKSYLDMIHFYSNLSKFNLKKILQSDRLKELSAYFSQRGIEMLSKLGTLVPMGDPGNRWGVALLGLQASPEVKKMLGDAKIAYSVNNKGMIVGVKAADLAKLVRLAERLVEMEYGVGMDLPHDSKAEQKFLREYGAELIASGIHYFVNTKGQMISVATGLEVRPEIVDPEKCGVVLVGIVVKLFLKIPDRNYYFDAVAKTNAQPQEVRREPLLLRQSLTLKITK